MANALGNLEVPLLNADFNDRVVSLPEDQQWQPTGTDGVTVHFLEVAFPVNPRLTLLAQFEPGSRFVLPQFHGGIEALVLNGWLAGPDTQYAPGTYLRIPTKGEHQFHSASGCMLFIKLGEFGQNDTEHRVINTNADGAWLPGPVEHTSVLPLHMHNRRSIFMIRWDADTAFQPGIDPTGEELFVVTGNVQDFAGDYPALSWIRNPVPVWQTWKASAGTIVYYKNGHFPAGYDR